MMRENGKGVERHGCVEALQGKLRCTESMDEVGLTSIVARRKVNFLEKIAWTSWPDLLGLTSIVVLHF